MREGAGVNLIRNRLARAFKCDLHGHCHETGETEDDVADAALISKSYLNNMANAHHGLLMEVAVRTIRALKRYEVAREFCRLIGGYFVLLPDADEMAETPVLEMVQECSHAWNDVAAAYRDGAISVAEHDHCAEAVDRTIEAALRLKARLDADRDRCRGGGRAKTLRETLQ
jgi:hypothetical protein